ncbi:SCO family protein [Imhoffiella purpurea]|uniref:Transmembrane protein n=1 Tax=Imhoffiella purpurea TaxID=1249627 RepID=W9VHS1_9GAMM|nr:hypothetical protein [Imhoffiella purpurea]EXJ16551.1 hypothetical protein D779_4104 [Imhoffiella purpurea]
MFLRNRHSLWVRLLVVLGAMSLFVLGYQWGNRHQHPDAEIPAIEGVLLQPPGDLPGFGLSDAFGRPFDQTRLADRWTLIGFGDLSHASGQRGIQRLIEVYNRVADQRELRERLQLVLVTTAEQPMLARRFAGLSPALHILGGDGDEIARLRGALGAGADAPLTLFVIAPGGYLLALFPDREDGSAMAEDLKAIVANAEALLPPETP